MALSTVFLIILILALLGALPSWPYSRGWGYGPSGLVGLVLVVVLPHGFDGTHAGLMGAGLPAGQRKAALTRGRRKGAVRIARWARSCSSSLAVVGRRGCGLSWPSRGASVWRPVVWRAPLGAEEDCLYCWRAGHTLAAYGFGSWSVRVGRHGGSGQGVGTLG